MFSSLMGGVYWLISQVMLFWHATWDKVLPTGKVLGTNWQWILAIVFLVITVRIVLFPIFVKQIKSQRAMQTLQPKMKALQEKHKGDKEALQRDVMELYKTEKVNPLMGCLPMFLQVPVFIGLLHVLRHLNPGTSLGQKTLYGWTVTQFDSAAQARIFDAPIAAKFSASAAEVARLEASGTTVKIVAAVLVLVMITTTYLTQRQMIMKTGWNEDPQQRMIQKFMLYGVPFFTLTSGWYFPIGVIIYWVTNNFITLGQQYWVLHKYPPPASATAGTKTIDGKVVGSKPGQATPVGKSGPPKPAAARPATSSAKAVTSSAGASKAVASKAAAPALPAAKGASSKAVGAKPAASNGASSKAAVPDPPAAKGVLSRASGMARFLPGVRTNGKAEAAHGANEGTPVVERKALAPKPGAKPTNPKKGGAAKRQSG